MENTLDGCAHEGSGGSPVPVLLVRRGSVTGRMLGPLTEDARIALIRVRDLSPPFVSLSERVSLVVVATTDDPFDGILYVRLAGVRGPVVVVGATGASRRGLLSAGAVACLELPLSGQDVDVIVNLARRQTVAVHLDALRLMLDPIGRVARFRQNSIRLTPREFALLHCLSVHAGTAVSAEDLFDYAWSDLVPAANSIAVVAVYVCQLRQKLRALGIREALSTVRGFGYKLAATTHTDHNTELFRHRHSHATRGEPVSTGTSELRAPRRRIRPTLPPAR